jgi:glutathione S-transferase
MKLYFTKGACSLAVRIVLNEIGLNCEYEAVDLKTKKTETNQDFLKINAKGAVPTLELDNGQTLTEAAIIQQYLADTYQARHLLPAPGDFYRYRILECLNYITAEVHKSFATLFSPTITQEVKEKIFIPLIKDKLAFIDKQLTNSYLMGNEFTLADAYMFVMLLWALNFKIDLKTYAHLPNYFAELRKRASIKKSLEQEGLMMT